MRHLASSRIVDYHGSHLLDGSRNAVDIFHAFNCATPSDVKVMPSSSTRESASALTAASRLRNGHRPLENVTHAAHPAAVWVTPGVMALLPPDFVRRGHMRAPSKRCMRHPPFPARKRQSLLVSALDRVLELGTCAECWPSRCADLKRVTCPGVPARARCRLRPLERAKTCGGPRVSS